MTAPDNLNTLYQGNLRSAMQWTARLLDASESAWKLQLDAADEISHTTFAHWRAASADIDASNPLSTAPAAITRSIERSTHVLRDYVDTAVKLQTGLAQILQSQLPILTSGLGGMWLAPWGEFVRSVAEGERQSAQNVEHRPRKAA
jgi:hypothetical protein